MREFDPTRRAALGSGMALLAAAPLVAAQAASRPGATMQAYQVGRQQGIDSLSLAERAVPHAGPGEVIIGVRASALNHRDLSILAGQYGAAKPPQRVPVGDGAGIVLECGPGVSTVQVGDRVTAPHFTPWLDGDYDPGVFAADLGNTRDGWLAERIVLPAAADGPVRSTVFGLHGAWRRLMPCPAHASPSFDANPKATVRRPVRAALCLRCGSVARSLSCLACVMICFACVGDRTRMHGTPQTSRK